jgi:5-formyltetrahydrofolate cyclo-ligase
MPPHDPIPAPPSADWEHVRHWRTLVREELIRRRMARSPDARRAMSERACTRLAQTVDLSAHPVLGFCWPIRGELDVRSIAEHHIARGGMVALPVIVQKAAPVEFWKWHPGVPMQKGIWNIPIPRQRDVLMPNAIIVPLVGYDECRFRLGYGGGYFDRTLAAAVPRPYTIGLGYADSTLQTIYPQAHDIPMDVIITA